MLGTLPPQKALSPYCLSLVTALHHKIGIVFHNFSSLYPVWLHPTREVQADHSISVTESSSLKICNDLTWYNPISWIQAGFKNNTDLFHAQWWSVPPAPALLIMCLFAKIRRIPVVVTAHNITPHERSTLFKWLSRLVFGLAEHLVVHTLHNKRTMMEKYGIPSKKIAVIPHGPLTVFTRGKDDLRKQYRIHKNEHVLLFFGAIRPYKGLDILLEALALVQNHIRIKLIIAGSLWESWDKYQAIIDKHDLKPNIIDLTGYVPADMVGSLFDATDLLVLPYSHFESQSGVGSAAIAFKVPMIVTQTGGLPDLVKDPACIIPKADSIILAQRIVDILSNKPLLKKIKNDTFITENEISWEHIARKTLSLYKRIINQ